MARWSNEVEYKAIALGVPELNWIHSLLSELGFQLKEVPRVFCDNLSATYMRVNSMFSTRMKHLALDYFFVHEKMNKNQLEVQHTSKLQLAGIN